MVNNRRKGTNKELDALKELQGNGWEARRVVNNSRFATEKDLYGLFDIIGLRKSVGILFPADIVFLQVTHEKSIHPHKNFIEFAKKYAGKNIYVEQWVWVSRKGWRKYRYYSDGTRKSKDWF